MSKKKKDQAVEDPQELEQGQPEEAASEPHAEAWKDKYLRALAELDNMRKRTERDRVQTHKYALEDVLRNILPVLDALHYALESDGDAAVIREGVEMAIKDAHRILGEQGFMPIEALHKPFDPRWHEAVGMRPHPDHPAGTVVGEERRGYRLHDRVLRPSRVHICIAAPEPVAADEEGADAPGESDADL